MAPKLQKLHCLTIHAVIFSLLLQKARSNENCENALQAINDCWDQHSKGDFRPCTTGSTTDISRCANLELLELKKCDEDVKKRGQHRARLYNTLMDVICENTTIYNEFASNKHCWNIARPCAYAIIQLPMKTSDLNCKNVTAIVEDCKTKSHNPYRPEHCLSVTKMFLDKLFEESQMCGASSIIGHLILILMSSYFLTLL